MDDNRLETQVREAEGFPILDVTGEIDISTGPLFKEALNRTLNEGHTRLIVNMTQVSYMDSSGFGILLGVTKKVRPVGGTVNLIGCNEAINRMLKITRLNTIFGLYDSEADAIRAVRNGITH